MIRIRALRACAAFVLLAPTGPTLSDALSSAIYSYVQTNDPDFAAATVV